MLRDFYPRGLERISYQQLRQHGCRQSTTLLAINDVIREIMRASEQ